MRSPTPLGLLRSRPLYARLFAAYGVSVFGDWFTFLAMSVLALRLSGGRALPVGLVLLLQFLPSALIGLVAGPLADRWHRVRLMVACDVFRGVVVGSAFFADTLPELYAVSLLVGVGATLFAPAQRATIPATVGEGELSIANAFADSIEALARMLGPVAASWLIAGRDPHVAFLVDAASYFASAVLLLPLVRRLPAPRQEARGTSLLHDLREGLRYHRENAVVWGLLLVQTILILGAFGFNALVVVMTERHYGRPDTDAGLIMTSMAAGLTLGNLALARYGTRLDRRMVIGWSYFAAGALTWVCISISDLVAALPAFVAIGFFNAGFVATHVSWLQEVVPDHLLGRVFAVRGVTLHLAVLVTQLGSTWLADRVGVQATIYLTGALILACSALTFLLPGLRTAREQASAAA